MAIHRRLSIIFGVLVLGQPASACAGAVYVFGFYAAPGGRLADQFRTPPAPVPLGRQGDRPDGDS